MEKGKSDFGVVAETEEGLVEEGGGERNAGQLKR